MSASVFPARAGMSPGDDAGTTNQNRVPRASGDEPSRSTEASTGGMCSPRERG